MELAPEGDVLVVRFISRAIVDGRVIQIIGDELFRLVDELGHRRVILDFSAVKQLSSSFLAKLMELDKRLRGVRGRLALCGLDPTVSEVFTVTKLNKILSIYPTESEAWDHV
jgi:anti-sigma B factor antagonist